MNYFSFHNPKSIPRLFYRIAELQTVSGNRMIKKFDLTTEQLILLFILYDEDGISQKTLADKSHKDQANVTRILKRLETKGFLDIKSTAEDKRLKLICLTNEGRDYLSSIFDYINKCGELACHLHDQDTLEQLVESLEAYIGAFDAHRDSFESLCVSVVFEGKIPKLKK